METAVLFVDWSLCLQRLIFPNTWSLSIKTVVAQFLDTFTNIVLVEVFAECFAFSQSPLGLDEENSVAMSLRLDLSGWKLFLAPEGFNRISLEPWTGQLVLYDFATRLCERA